MKNNEILEKKLWRISNLSSKVEDFKVFVRLFRLPILMIALYTHKLILTMLINGFLLIKNYMYKEDLIRIKDYPSWHFLVQSQQ